MGSTKLESLPAARRLTIGCAVALIGLAPLAACNKAAVPADSGTSPISSTTPSTAAASDAASAAPSMAGIKPHVDDAPASAAAGTGPAEGSTAVGGVVGNQDSGGARKGGTPAPTGGDSAGSAPK